MYMYKYIYIYMRLNCVYIYKIYMWQQKRIAPVVYRMREDGLRWYSIVTRGESNRAQGVMGRGRLINLNM